MKVNLRDIDSDCLVRYSITRREICHVIAIDNLEHGPVANLQRKREVIWLAYFTRVVLGIFDEFKVFDVQNYERSLVFAHGIKRVRRCHVERIVT